MKSKASPHHHQLALPAIQRQYHIIIQDVGNMRIIPPSALPPLSIGRPRRQNKKNLTFDIIANDQVLPAGAVTIQCFNTVIAPITTSTILIKSVGLIGNLSLC
ncbi:hypothetical protein [Edwardsiella anguillarum]|nr:hypothetical protein [Edwardsiella anguillarum]